MLQFCRVQMSSTCWPSIIQHLLNSSIVVFVITVCTVLKHIFTTIIQYNKYNIANAAIDTQ